MKRFILLITLLALDAWVARPLIGQVASTGRDTLSRYLVLDRVVATAAGGMNEDRFVAVAVSVRTGRIAVLTPEELREYRDGSLERRIARPDEKLGPRPQEALMAYGPGDEVHVIHPYEEQVSIFRRDGTVDRKALPFRIMPAYSIAVDGNGHPYVSGFAKDATGGQVHMICPDYSCRERSFVELRETKHPEARGFFQGGYIDSVADTVFFASVNPYALVTAVLSRGAVRFDTLARDDILSDGEAAAFEYEQETGRRSISNFFARTTGFVRSSSGGFFYTAMIPELGGSLLRLVAADGRVVAEANVPGAFDVQGELPTGELVVLRMYGRQEVAVYRVRWDAAR